MSRLSKPQCDLLIEFLSREEACQREGVAVPAFWCTDGFGGGRVSKALKRRGLVELGRDRRGHMAAALTLAGRTVARLERIERQLDSSKRPPSDDLETLTDRWGAPAAIRLSHGHELRKTSYGLELWRRTRAGFPLSRRLLPSGWTVSTFVGGWAAASVFVPITKAVVKTSSQLWKDMCRSLEDKRDGEGFEDYRRDLNTFAVFELSEFQAKKVQSKVGEGDDDQVEISPFPFPRMSVVCGGLVLCLHEPLMDPRTSEFSFEVFVYQDGFEFTGGHVFDRFVMRARVFVHSSGRISGFEECCTLTYLGGSRVFSLGDDVRHDRPLPRHEPLKRRKPNKVSTLTKEEAEAEVERLKKELEEVQTEREQLDDQVKDLDIDYNRQVQGMTDTWFRYALACVRWIAHPDHFTVEVDTPGKPRRAKEGRVPRLGEQARYILMEKHEIAEAWKRANHGGTHASPIPHLRRGHFKRLQAECFKEKRGKLIWVRATHVNGKCVEWRNGNITYRVV